MFLQVLLITLLPMAYGGRRLHAPALINDHPAAGLEAPFQLFHNSENIAHCECGKPINIHRDPWQLYLYVLTDSSGPDILRVCAVTIISTDIVVTSAQCTLRDNQNAHSSGDTSQHYHQSQLLVSPFLRNYIPNKQYKVLQTHYVPEIRHAVANGDVLLIKLEVDFSRENTPHRPICLPRESDLEYLNLDYLYSDKTGVTYTYQQGQRYIEYPITPECADDHPATVSKYNATHAKMIYAGKLFGTLDYGSNCDVETSESSGNEGHGGEGHHTSSIPRTETSICQSFQARSEYFTVLCGTPLMHSTAKTGSPVLLVGITCNQTQPAYWNYYQTIYRLVTVTALAIRKAANLLDTSWCVRPDDHDEYSLRNSDGGYSSPLSATLKWAEGTQSFPRYSSIQSGINWNPTTGGSWESLPTAQSVVKSLDCSCGLANTDVRDGGRASSDFISGRIINGVAATPYEFGWVVKIIVDEGWMCTGSIINDRMVLTAAHCVATGEQQLNVSPDKFTVMVNIHKSDGDENSFAVPVQDVVHHPGSLFTFRSYDMAVLVLKRSLNFVGDASKGIRPICVSDEYFSPEVEGVITGFGRTKNDEPDSLAKVLQKAHVKIWSRDECQRRIPERDACVILQNNVCVYDYDGGKQINLGDSGGPAMAKDWRGKYHQLGVCSSLWPIFNEKDWTWKYLSVFVNPRKLLSLIYHVSNLAGAKWCKN